MPCFEVWPGLLVKRWGRTQAVVFHPALNSTHLVDACAGSVLMALLQSPGSGLQALTEDFPEQDTEATVEALLQAGMLRLLAR